MKFPYVGRFGDFIEIILGGTPKTSNSNYWGGDIPWASVVDFTDNKRLYITEKTITKEGLKNSNTKLLQQGDIILSARGTVGKLVVCGLSMAFNQSCYALRTKDNCLINQDFLYYYVKHIVTELQQKAVGGVFDTIIKSTLDGISLYVPEVSKQRKIASILSAYDDLIENNLRRIKLLEEAAQMIYKEWFVNFKFPGYEKAKFVNGLPEGWKKTNLFDVAVIKYGYAFKGKYFNEDGNGYPIIRIRDIPKQEIRFFTTEKTDESYIVKRGDLVIGMDGEFHINNWCKDDAYLVQRVCRIRPKDILLNGYLSQAIIEPIKYYESTIVGATVSHLGHKHLKEIEIIIPNEITYKQLSVFNYYLNQKVKLASMNSLLKQARDILLPKLMSGEIEV